MDDMLKLNHLQLLAILATLMPAPEKSRVTAIMESQRLANPYNDSYKPKRYSETDIIATLRVKDALAIVDAVYTQTMVNGEQSTSLRREGWDDSAR